MRNLVFATASLCLVFLMGSGATQAQTIQNAVQNVSLKSGESAEISQLYSIGTNCQSLLKATPEVEIMDGPPGVTATVTEAKVVPRTFSCAKPVPGGKLVITAKDIDEQSFTRMVLRVKYRTTIGDRQVSVNLNVALFPAN